MTAARLHGALPYLPVAQKAASSTSAAGRTRRESNIPLPTATGSPRLPVLPTLGLRPLRPAVATQRQAVQPDDDRGAAATPGTDPEGQQRTGPPSPTSGTTAILRHAGGAFPMIGAVSPPTVAASGERENESPIDLGRAALSGWPGSTERSRPTRSIAALPSRDAISARPVQRAVSSDLALARPAYVVPSSVSPTGPGPGAPPAEAALVQRFAAGPTLAPTATPIVQRIDGRAPVADEAPAGRSERELDELATSLFGRFRTQLKSELIHDREARGLPFDDV